MAQLDYRANLASKGFPFLPRNRGRTVIIPGQDQIYSRYGSPTERTQDVGIPQLMAGHNFLPTPEGYQTIQPFLVNNNSVFPQYSGAVALRFRKMVQTFGGNYESFFGTELSNGYTVRQFDTDLNYAPDQDYGTSGGPVMTGASTDAYDSNAIQHAILGGQSYVYHKIGVSYTISTVFSRTFVPQVMLGLATDIKGILTSYGYLIAYNDSSVAWSSTSNPLDFVPSLVTGAGGGSLQETRGKILFCLPTSFGFIVYAEDNCVSATYTGNARYPFSFKEISGAGGGISRNLVAYDPVRATHIAYTKFGMQELSRDSASNILPELGDFINAAFYEEFNTTTWEFDLYKAAGTRTGSLKLIAGRYIIYSYTVNSTDVSTGPAFSTPAEYPVFNYALIYDLQYERWGKVKIDHTDCFFFDDWYEEGIGYTTVIAGGLPARTVGISSLGDAYKKFQGSCKFAFLQPNGDIYAFTTEATPTLSADTADCCMVFGRFQYARSRRLCLDEVTVERPVVSVSDNPLPSNSIQLRVLESDNGREVARITEGYLATDSSEMGVWNFSCDALNYLIAIAGHVNINTLLLKYHIGGEA